MVEVATQMIELVREVLWDAYSSWRLWMKAIVVKVNRVGSASLPVRDITHRDVFTSLHDLRIWETKSSTNLARSKLWSIRNRQILVLNEYSNNQTVHTSSKARSFSPARSSIKSAFQQCFRVGYLMWAELAELQTYRACLLTPSTLLLVQ